MNLSIEKTKSMRFTKDPKGCNWDEKCVVYDGVWGRKEIAMGPQ